MKIFITGGCGFIGSALASLFSVKHEVATYDIVDSQDVLDRPHLESKMYFSLPDIVIHCAAIAGIYKTSADAAKTINVNLIGTRNVLEAAAWSKAKLFINFSTSEVYGPHIYDGRESDMTTQGPSSEKRWAYAVSKLAGEYMVRTSGLAFVNLRPFNIFGPGQTGEGAIHDIVTCALAGKPIVVYNDGVQIRSWCYIADFAEAVEGIIENPESWNETYNIGNPKNTITVLRLAMQIKEACGSDSPILFKPYPGPEVHVRIPNIEKAKRNFNFNPKTDLDEGLEKTIAYYRGRL